MATTTRQITGLDGQAAPAQPSAGSTASTDQSTGGYEVISESAHGDENRPVSLEGRWNRADRAIRAAIRKAERLKRIQTAPLGGAGLLLNYSSILRRSFRETREALTPARKLAQSEIVVSGPTSVPRAFTIADRFLAATGGKFEKDGFLKFLKSFRDSLPLQLAEFWLMKPLAALALMERIADVAEDWTKGDSNGGSGSPEAQSAASAAILTLTTSLQNVMDWDWEEAVGEVSETEAILREDPSGHYCRMDVESRQMYRNAVADLAASCECTEQQIAGMAIRLAKTPQAEPNRRARERRTHVGYYLVDKGSKALKLAVQYAPPLAKRIQEAILSRPAWFYFSGIALVILAVLGLFFAIGGEKGAGLIEFVLLLLLGIDAAVAAVNFATTQLISPKKLSKMDFSKGIPDDCATLVVVPTLLTSEAQVKQAVRELEVRYLANSDANLHFALLTDPPDSTKRFDEKDGLAEMCSDLIRKLNDRYAHRNKGSFLHFHRHRIYCPSEGIWMGWERKRGKLLDFNNLLLGRDDRFPIKTGDLMLLRRIKYVITLDQDTQLPKESAVKLVATLAHPLNRAVVDSVTNTVVEGYGIIQPRVEISMQSSSQSRLAAISSGDTGFDIYTRAVSDVYQDLFSEGIFTGKGIYEVETFQQVLGGRFPANRILSHDLIEGAHARTGLASDIEVVDDYPTHVGAYSRRKHRWIRGDWQIANWLFGRVPNVKGEAVRNPLNFISRWKIADNLRRSLADVTMLAVLLWGWFVSPHPLYWTIAVVGVMALSLLFQFFSAVIHGGRKCLSRSFWKNLGQSVAATSARLVLRAALLCFQSLVALDAVVRTLVRMTISHKKLLQWETAAQAERFRHLRGSVEDYLNWAPWFSVAVALLMAVYRPWSLFWAAPFLLAWGLSKPLCAWLNRPREFAASQIGTRDGAMVRQSALRTWRFFREFSTAEENWLIPDIVREEPDLVAHRSSPTNLGFLLNSRIAAYDMGFLSLSEFITATERTFDTFDRMPKWNGHFFNWYENVTLEAVAPRFVSTVDSGNLVCCLWTLRQACLEFTKRPPFRKAVWEGIHDHLAIVEELVKSRNNETILSKVGELKSHVESLADAGWTRMETLSGLAALVTELETELESEYAAGDSCEEIAWWVHELSQRVSSVQELVQDFAPWLMPQFAATCREAGIHNTFRIEDLSTESLAIVQTELEEKLHRIAASDEVSPKVRAEMRLLGSLLSRSRTMLRDEIGRLLRLAAAADSLADKMDFAILYNSEKKLLSIGYDVEEGHVHKCVYDLLASEARSAAFVAVAKGDIPQESWLHLSRLYDKMNSGHVLLSWTGTMFEYLMPFLWMKCPANTTLGQTSRIAVNTQREYADFKGVPWGISESSAKDVNPDGHYRYHAFGVPCMALSQVDANELVIAPYATFLSLLVDPAGAVDNLAEMRKRGWVGSYGFYEACDFTPASSGAAPDGEIVRCWMAHHQGMILVAAANVLCDSAIRNRFHAEPSVAAVERLLEEKPLRLSSPDPSPHTNEEAPDAADDAADLAACGLSYSNSSPLVMLWPW